MWLPPHLYSSLAFPRCVCAVEVGPDYITYYLDGVVLRNHTAVTVPGIRFWPDPNFFIINTAIGDWGPMPSDNTVFPGYLSLEHARVAVRR